MASLIFEDAEKARDKICAEDQKKIRQLYEDWAADVGERAQYYAGKTTASSYWQEQQMLELQRQLTEQSKVISNQIYNGTKESLYTVADAVVGCNAKFLADLGFPSDGVQAAFTDVPTQIVNNIVTGQIYQGGWNLSAAIWGNNESMLADIYSIVAQGRAMNMSAYEVANLLEVYVNPDKEKPWNLQMPDGVKIYKKSVDYNAQRLARTLTQHAYQQGIIQSAKANPFIQSIIWRANGSRVCELCEARDGKEYAWNEVPMDHPNGMCVMEPKVDMDATVDKLVDWYNADDGTYPEIDQFAAQFGYVPNVSELTETQKTWLQAAGYADGEMPKDFSEFAHRLDIEQQAELLYEAGGTWNDPHPYQVMEKYYNANIAKSGNAPAVKAAVGNTVGVESLGTSKSKTFNYWYTKLDANQKALAQKLKAESGLTWQQWYEKNIYSGAKQAAKATAKTVASTPQMVAIKANGKTIANMSLDDVRAIFDTQDQAGMLSLEARAFSKMTNAQSAGIRTYTGSAYEEMNGYLRALAAGKTKDQAMNISGIYDSQLTALKNARAGLATASLEKDLVLRRGTDLGDLAGLLPGDFYTNKTMLENMTVDELNAKFAGTVGTYAGFTSTSSLWDRGFDGDVEVIFNAPAGIQASSVMSISRFGTSEGETLLNAGTVVRVAKIEESVDRHKDSRIRIFMDIIGNK